MQKITQINKYARLLNIKIKIKIKNKNKKKTNISTRLFGYV